MHRPLLWILVAALAWMPGCSGEEPAELPDLGMESDESDPDPDAPEVPLDPATYGSLSGVVRVKGSVPTPRTQPLGVFPECHEHGGTSIPVENLIVKDGKLENALVFLKRGLPRNFESEVPTETVTIDQRGCRFVPHFSAARTGQPVLYLNSDQGAHNVHYYAKRNPAHNFGLSEVGKRTVVHERSEIMKLGCDIHPFMRAYLAVFDHPFFFVTGPDGTWKLDGVPPGEYTVRVWHETLGEQDGKVVLEPNGTAVLDFELSVTESS